MGRPGKVDPYFCVLPFWQAIMSCHMIGRYFVESVAPSKGND